MEKGHDLMQECPHPVLEGCCPAGFRCFPASGHLTQINASLAGLCRTERSFEEIHFI